MTANMTQISDNTLGGRFPNGIHQHNILYIIGGPLCTQSFIYFFHTILSSDVCVCVWSGLVCIYKCAHTRVQFRVFKNNSTKARMFFTYVPSYAILFWFIFYYFSKTKSTLFRYMHSNK